MPDQLEAVCLRIRSNLKKEEESITESNESINELSQQIDESTTKQLVTNLHVLMPTILEIINNFEFKLKGILLIDQLVQALDHQHFVKQGYDNLIIFTLKNQFYHQDEELFKVLFTITYNALIKFNYQTVNSTKILTELDEIVDIVLNLIEIGTDDNVRLISLEELPKLFSILDKAVYKHLSRLIDNFVYIVDPDFITARPKQIKACLLMLNQLINLTSEKFDVTKSLITLIKVLFNLNELKSEHNNEFKDKEFQSIHNETLNCLKQIARVDSASFKSYLKELEQNDNLNLIYQMVHYDLNLIASDP